MPSRANVLVTMSIVCLSALSCGDKSPTAPRVPPIPSARIETSGTLTYNACRDWVAPGGWLCNFKGEAKNEGQGCAINVRGITRLFDASNDKELAKSEWSLDAGRRINPGESFLYRGEIWVADVKEHYYQTECFWDNVRCPS